MKLKFLSLCIITIWGSVSAQSTYFVNLNASGTGTGASWGNAFVDLQSALTVAQAGDKIYVAKGVYKPTAIPGSSLDPRDKTFIVKERTYIYGGFAGTEASLANRSSDSTALFVTNKTILSGDLGTPSDSSDNAYHVVVSLNSSDSTVLDGFVIAEGNADDSSTYTINTVSVERNFGGGVFSSNSNLWINNCIIENNLAYSGGAGINNVNGSYGLLTNSYVNQNIIWGSNPNDFGGAGMRNNNSSPWVEDVQFVWNEIYNIQGGGAVRNEGSSPIFYNVLFIENYAENGDGGAGMYNASNSGSTLIKVKFIGNETTDQGAGMYNDGSKPTIENALFYQNHSDGGGGAMENDGGSDLTLIDVDFIENSADDNGGAVQLWKSSPTMMNVRFINNYSALDGGGLYNYNDCSPIITNALFDGNVAGRNGGGMYNKRNSNPVLTNGLIINNYAGEFGGGTYTVTASGAPCSPITTNTTAVNNRADSSGGGGFDDGAGNSKVRNSIIMGNYSPNGVDEIDAPSATAATALFRVIIGNEYYVNGTTLPSIISGAMFVDSANGDYNLANNSYALDKGDSTYYNSGKTPDLSFVETDINFAIRTQGANTDLGAYEFCASQPLNSVTIAANNPLPKNGDTVLFTATYPNYLFNPSIEWYINDTLKAVNVNPFPAIVGIDLSNNNRFYDYDNVYAKVTSKNPCIDSMTVKSNILKYIWWGVKDYSNLIELTIYPNPNNGQFTISSELEFSSNINLVVTDMSGRMITQRRLTSNSKSYTFDLSSEMEPGIYLLRLQEGIEVIGNTKMIVR